MPRFTANSWLCCEWVRIENLACEGKRLGIADLIDCRVSGCWDNLQEYLKNVGKTWGQKSAGVVILQCKTTDNANN
jgi:hypothetical protein